MKFCKTFLMSKQARYLLGRCIRKVIPLDIRYLDDAIPVLSVFFNKNNRQLVIRCDRIKRFSRLEYDSHGDPVLVPVKVR